MLKLNTMPFKDHPYEPLLSPNSYRRRKQIQNAFLRCIIIPICFGLLALLLCGSRGFLDMSRSPSRHSQASQPMVRIVIDNHGRPYVSTKGTSTQPTSNDSNDQTSSESSSETTENENSSSHETESSSSSAHRVTNIAPPHKHKCHNANATVALNSEIISTPQAEFTPSPAIPAMISQDGDSDFDSDFWSSLDTISSSEIGPSNLHQLGEQAVVFKTIVSKLKTRTRKELKPRDKRLLLSLESSLFPWIQDNLAQLDSLSLLKSYKDQGIVMALSQKDVKFGLHLVQSLINVLETPLPIEIFHVGSDSETGLSPEAIALFDDVPNVKFIDIYTIIPSAERYGITSTSALKPFSILFSSFSEVIYLNPDTVFLQDPYVLLLYDDYVTNGVIFFRDRTVTPEISSDSPKNADGDQVPNPSGAWLYADRAIQNKSDYLISQGRLLSNVSTLEGISSVIVWNKEMKFSELLLASLLNSAPYQTDLYNAFKDDRDSYWIAHEMMESRYVWAPSGGGVIGYRLPGDKVCGHVFHPDLSLQALWFSGTILTNRESDSDEAKKPLEITNWIMDATLSDDWVSHEGVAPYCMEPTTGVLGVLTEAEKSIVEATVKQWKEIDEMVDIHDNKVVLKEKNTHSDGITSTSESSSDTDSSSESSSSKSTD